MSLYRACKKRNDKLHHYCSVFVLISDTTPSTTEQAKHFTKSFFRYSDSTGGRAKRRSQAGELRDLLVILDSSGSIGNGVFSDAKEQIGRLVALLCPQPDPFNYGYQQLAFMTFSKTVSEIFQFDSYTSVSDIQSAIKQAPYLGSSTCTATAFNYIENMFQSTKGQFVKLKHFFSGRTFEFMSTSGHVYSFSFCLSIIILINCTQMYMKLFFL